MAIITVDVLDDITDAMDGETTLREAIAAASAGDTIVFDVGPMGGTLVLTQGQLALTQDITIDGDTNGDNVADITIDANNASRVFSITNGGTGADVMLDALNIANGNAGMQDGGGVYVLSGASVNIYNSNLTGNSARFGGALLTRATSQATVSNTSFSDNTAVTGGAISNRATSTLTVTDGTFTNNTAEKGGAIENGGTAMVYASTFTGNNAASGSGLGGGIYINNAGQITITDTTLSGNAAFNNGGQFITSASRR